jgi:hypothetical protein
MREFPDDTTSPACPDKKRLVCAAPRASSKRLALTLIDEIAGLLGVNAMRQAPGACWRGPGRLPRKPGTEIAHVHARRRTRGGRLINAPTSPFSLNTYNKKDEH